MALRVVGQAIWSLSLGMPVPPPAPQTVQAYVIQGADGDLHVIDPGWESEPNWTLFEDSFAAAGLSVGDIRTVTATHLHHDHVGLAARIREISGAAIAVHRDEQDAMRDLVLTGGALPLVDWGVPETVIRDLTAAQRELGVLSLEADVLLEDGDALPVSGRRVEVMHTPGHTPGHIALYSQDDSILFVGDLVLQGMYPGVGLGGSSPAPLADMVSSLRRVGALQDALVLPGHGEPFRDIGSRAAAISEHHLARAREVATILKDEADLVPWEVARRMTWSRGWTHLQGNRLATALAQAAMYSEFVRESDHALLAPHAIIP